MKWFRLTVAGLSLAVSSMLGVVGPQSASASGVIDSPVVNFSGTFQTPPCSATGTCHKDGISIPCSFTYSNGGTTVTTTGCYVVFSFNMAEAACYGSGLGTIEFHLQSGTPLLPVIGTIPVALAYQGGGNSGAGNWIGTNGLERTQGNFTALRCSEGTPSQAFSGSITLAT
jgi:hypothetical protein